MASGPITTWQIEGEKVEVVTDFLFLGSKITLDGDCSHEIRRQSLLSRKTVTNLDGLLKSREITLLTKVHILKAMGKTRDVFKKLEIPREPLMQNGHNKGQKWYEPNRSRQY